MAASRIARLAYRWLAWLFVACVVVQFFFAGLGVFVPGSTFELHRNWGYTFGYLLLFMIAAALIGRMPRAAWEIGAAQRQLPLDRVPDFLIRHYDRSAISTPTPLAAVPQ